VVRDHSRGVRDHLGGARPNKPIFAVLNYKGATILGARDHSRVVRDQKVRPLNNSFKRPDFPQIPQTLQGMLPYQCLWIDIIPRIMVDHERTK